VSALHAAIPGVRVVMVDMEVDQSTFLRAVRAGVVGYVLKDASAVEVGATISAVAEGGRCVPRLSPWLCSVMWRSIANPPEMRAEC
jgi:DNA-binding NarL/FixJ family response regulator